MTLTDELIQGLRRLSSFYDDPLLSDAAERLELCNKSNSAMLRQINRQNEELEAVKDERDRMLADMHGVCILCAYYDGPHCLMNVTDTGGYCAFWRWRGYK